MMTVPPPNMGVEDAGLSCLCTSECPLCEEAPYLFHFPVLYISAETNMVVGSQERGDREHSFRAGF